MKQIRRRAHAAFSNPRIVVSVLLFGIAVALFAVGIAPSRAARIRPQPVDVAKSDPVQMAGPISQDSDLRALPVIPPTAESEDQRLMRHPLPGGPAIGDPLVVTRRVAQAVTMPGAALVINGVTSAESGCGCLPPDPQGDVGLHHYIETVNSAFRVYDKTGNALTSTSYNSFFAPLASSGTPCGSQNRGDGFVFYDHLVDRWVVSDFAFAGFPGSSFYQCIGVSKTNDPVSGGWWLYALQVDPNNPTYLGDYPKFAVWSDAWYLTMNLFTNNTTFTGVRVYALDRTSMINGTGSPAPNAVGFTINASTLGDTYSLLPAMFRTGNPPPAGLPEYLLAIDSPSSGGVVQNQVHAWRFHVDFTTPANSTLGLGPTHAADGNISVNAFTDAFSNTELLVPQPGTTQNIDTLGDKLMTPLVYTNFGGKESLWATHTINNNQNGTGPSAIRWYQFNVSGNTIPATPAQQQTFDNGADGIWRFMPSIAVDAAGNMAIGYAASSSDVFPSIRWAGRLTSDPANTLAQGEAVAVVGGGSQTHSSGRWGDYSYMSVDPTDNLSFWHANEYYSTTSDADWKTAIAKFRFANGPIALSAVSRKTHGGTATFDVNLPLTGNVGVESRNGSPAAGQHQVIATLNASSTVAFVSASPAPATVDSFAINGSQVTLNLSNVPNPSRLTITLSGVNDGVATGNVTIPAGFLIGDANGDGIVNSADATVTRNASGASANSTNFRSDYNLDGSLNSADATVVRARSGNALPP